MIGSTVVRSSLLLALLASTGCHALLGIDDFQTVDAGSAPDAPADALLPDAQVCFGTLTRICRASAPTGTVIIAGSINTNTDPRCETFSQSGGPDVCVIAGGTLSIENTFAHGTRPLVLLAAGALTVNGRLDVSSTRTGPSLGAAASTNPCQSAQNGATGVDGGGGAGGSFGTLGGAGGDGGAAGAGSSGGTANPVAGTLTAIRAGCAGGDGGGPAASGGTGGAPGGAVALYAGSQIAIIAAGSVFASGAGARAGLPTSGAGGGGGSGGLIVLDAPSIQVLGTVAANAGAGGGGADDQAAADGGDGSTVQHTTPATGGAAQTVTKGGTGGNGFAGTTAPQAGGSPPAVAGSGGGGGGGGGAGIIWVHGTLAGANKFSPAPELH